ncbi:MAG: cob(I)yrinic acid a,c-diamide adenosyltransferase [Bacteroidales bacterium]
MSSTKSKLYTKTGDQGKTSLVGGRRVSKSSLRLHAYGTIDELNANIGLLICEISSNDEQIKTLQFIQHKLFSVGGYLATEPDSPYYKHGCTISEENIKHIEGEIDAIDQKLPPLNRFVLPGGNRAAAQAHICRTVTRRAERLICEISETEAVSPLVLQFVNRISDYLFAYSRELCLKSSQEIFWDKDCI